MGSRTIKHFTIEDIKQIVIQESITTVSFDFFDTLLLRPSMRPTDIFHLLQNKVRQKYDLDFIDLRLYAEAEMKNENATIVDIWNYIQKKHSLNVGVANALMNLEIELETRLLTVNTEMLSVLKCAKEAGKRVIITSDMYLGSEILSAILREKGIVEVDAVYVSCDLHARKSDGRIFHLVAEKEGIEDLSQMVHIGDNVRSDYQKSMTAMKDLADIRQYFMEHSS